MKKIKRIITLAVAFAFILHTIGYANVRHVTLDEYDPRNMTFEERAAWVEKNVEPIHVELGDRVSTRADGEWLYTNIKRTTAKSQTGYEVGTLETQARWMVDQNENVLDWASVRCEAIPITMNLNSAELTVSKKIANNNVRMVYEAWFSELSGAYFIEHWYNLHGSGAYDVRVVTGSEN